MSDKKGRAPRTRKALFKKLHDERETDSGRACVVLAERIMGQGEELHEWQSREARQWAKLGIEADKAARDQSAAELEAIKDALEKRAARASKLDALAGNVVRLPERSDGAG